jgi:hypothetical protein
VSIAAQSYSNPLLKSFDMVSTWPSLSVADFYFH